MKRANMYFIDWLTVPIWCALFPLDQIPSAVIMAFVAALFCWLNHRNSKKTMSLVLMDVNLMGATVLGILLSNLLFIRFVYADRDRVSLMVVIIFLALVYETLLMIISMIIKEIGRRRRRRIINRLAMDEPSDEDADDADEDDEDADDYDEDDGYDDDDLLEDDEAERGYGTERRVLESLGHIGDNGGSDAEDTADEDDTAEDEAKGPKFKVIKKAKK